MRKIFKPQRIKVTLHIPSKSFDLFSAFAFQLFSYICISHLRPLLIQLRFVEVSFFIQKTIFRLFSFDFKISKSVIVFRLHFIVRARVRLEYYISINVYETVVKTSFITFFVFTLYKIIRYIASLWLKYLILSN